jgi:DNA-directed RNA polymerase specialized sigma24 family protein
MAAISRGEIVMEARGEADVEPKGAPHRADAYVRKKWTLTQEAFDRLLAALDPDREDAGKKYLEIRGSLIRFFEWRGSPFPEDHADEAINRVAKRISEGEEIRTPIAYFLGAARMLMLEIQKEQARERHALGELAHAETVSYEFEELEPRIRCLERCLKTLTAENRELILQYYQGDKGAKIESRKRLTDRFKIPLNTLRMRALRIREKLQACVENCLNHKV